MELDLEPRALLQGSGTRPSGPATIDEGFGSDEDEYSEASGKSACGRGRGLCVRLQHSHMRSSQTPGMSFWRFSPLPASPASNPLMPLLPIVLLLLTSARPAD